MLRQVITVLLMSYQATMGLMGSAGLHAVFGAHHGCWQHAISASQADGVKPSPSKQRHGHCCHRHPVPCQPSSQSDRQSQTSDEKHESPPHDHENCWLCDLWLSISAPMKLPTEVVVVLLPTADAPHRVCLAASLVLNAACSIRGPPVRLV